MFCEPISSWMNSRALVFQTFSLGTVDPKGPRTRAEFVLIGDRHITSASRLVLPNVGGILSRRPRPKFLDRASLF